LPSSSSGGARSADEVMAQTTISAMKAVLAPAPVVATNGSATKAAHDSAVISPTTIPSRPTTPAILSATIPIAVSVTVKTA
jgi:hypothetical protein